MNGTRAIMAVRRGPSERGGACVVELGLLAHRTLRRGRRGRIAAVFDRSLYATFDDDWICIGHTAIGSGPLHVLCDGIAVGELSAGQEIAVNDTAVFVGDAELSDLDAAPVWSPPPPPDWTHETLHAGIRAVDSTWHVAAWDDGLAAAGCAQLLSAPSRTVAAAMPAIAALKRAIGAGLRGQEAALVDGTETIGLIGLGPGLTPSGDDLLGG